ncbi:HAD family hydrolase [Stakelama sediminis]|uniref:Phosphoglycolate phosphatase n=1 Tax=Stakelama sediminis TaxID=463200 RepID=A0A840Z0X0_9SPHN|nr:phosphoglycolate phosphatase [Stakelama sediminis]MBB5719380.1 phosphoglycolate phosphatase [Stakelama sediminis]
MSDFPFAIIGFDLDGTLVDSSGDLTSSVNIALAELGRAPVSREQVLTFIGGGSPRMLRRALEATGGCPNTGFDALYDRMIDYYAAHIALETHAFPGVETALDTLAARGVTLAVVTNKPEHLADKLLRELGLRDRFACLIGGDSLGEGKRKPDRAPIDAMVERCGGGKAAFVGDSDFDTRAARNAGVPCVAVSFGFAHGPVAELGADAVIDRYADLIPVLERLS